MPAETHTCTMNPHDTPHDYPQRSLNGATPTQSDPNVTITKVDQESAALATPVPVTLDLNECPWLDRWRIRHAMSEAQRKGLVGAVNIDIKRRLTMMEHAAEGAILMAKRHWEGLVQLHGAQQVTQFAMIFLELQDSFMNEVVEATAKVEDRATRVYLRIQAKNDPDFVKLPALEENESRFRGEMAVVRTLSERIGETLRTRLGQDEPQ